MRLSEGELYDLVRRHGAITGADDIAVAGAQAESDGDTEARGDLEDGEYHSHGLWQMYDEGLGAGISVADRRDPDKAAAVMVPLYNQHYQEGQQLGLDGETLARWAYMNTEKPLGWTSRNPGIWSAAANRFAEKWAALDKTAAETEMVYNPNYNKPAYQQKNSWTCSICAMASALGSIGYQITPAEMQDKMVNAGIVDSSVGLHYGDGHELVTFLHNTYGIESERVFPASFDWVAERAGKGPILVGGHNWYHWVMVRDKIDENTLSIANSADGYDKVYQTINRWQWDQLGDFAAVYIPVGEQADVPPEQPVSDEITGLKNTIGYLMVDVADALEEAIQGVENAKNIREARNAAKNGLRPVLETLRRGGPPEEE